MSPKRLNLFLLFASLTLWSACGNPKSNDSDYVWAEGKGFTITNADLDMAVKDQVERIKKSGREPSGKQIEEIRRRNLAFVIDRKLIDLEIGRIKPANLDKLISSQIEKSNQLSPAPVNEGQITAKADAIRRKVSWELVLLDHSRKIPVPDEKQARELYDKNPDRWQVPGMVEGVQFLWPAAAHSSESDWRTYKTSLAEVRKKVKENVPVSAIQRERLAKNMPPLLITSASWPTPSLSKELGEGVDKIRKGEVTEIFKSPRGLMFYRVEQVTPGKKLSFQEALPRIQEQAKREQLRGIRRNLLRDLRQTYEVQMTSPESAPAS